MKKLFTVSTWGRGDLHLACQELNHLATSGCQCIVSLESVEV